MFTIAAPATVLIAIRSLAALIFLSAASAKMRHWAAFEGVVANYRLLPRVLVAAAAYALPPVEAAIGASLLIGLFVPALAALSQWASLAAAALLGVFAAAMAVNLVRGRAFIDCGCFQGTLKQALRWPLVARNAVLMLVTGATAGSASAPAAGLEALNGLLAGGSVFMILQSVNALLAVKIGFRRRGAV